MIIFAYTEIDLKKKLSLLEIIVYYINKLKVNTSKSRVLVFQFFGKSKSVNLKCILFGQDHVERVNSYVYLGVSISSLALSLCAARNTIYKSNIASGNGFFKSDLSLIRGIVRLVCLIVCFGIDSFIWSTGMGSKILKYDWNCIDFLL